MRFGEAADKSSSKFKINVGCFVGKNKNEIQIGPESEFAAAPFSQRKNLYLRRVFFFEFICERKNDGVRRRCEIFQKWRKVFIFQKFTSVNDL
ncbi:hypothetical protein D3C87_1502770 [compost metagenome]